jgi:hypothetical protein
VPDLRVPMLAFTAAVVFAGTVGCSSSSTMPNQTKPNQTSSSTAPSSAVEHGAYARCLTDNGVPAPLTGGAGPGPANDQPTAPPGVDPQTWDNAMRACASLAPGPPGP